MFLRRNRREVNGESYEYWTLVESYRTERGPRQRVVASLGKLAGLDQEERHGWEEIEWLLEGQRPPRQLKLGTDEQTLGDERSALGRGGSIRGASGAGA